MAFRALQPHVSVRASVACRGVLLALFVTAAPAAYADTVDLTPSKDNTVFAPAFGTLLSNGAGNYTFAGTTALPAPNGDTRRVVMAFSLAGRIPAGSTITGVTLTLHMSRTISGAEVVGLHRLTADWGEGASQALGEEGAGAPPATGDVTWLHRFYPDTLWTTPGGDFSATVSASASVADVGFYTWGSASQMVADAQGWLDDPAGNFGWMLIGVENAAATAKRFDSRENATPANRPKLTVTFSPPLAPLITSQPQSHSVCAGESVTFSVTATDATGYQWRHNATNITGATGASYTLNGVTAADAGTYTVVVSNGAGSVTSDPAALTVGIAPVISGQPSSQSANVGGAVTFMVTATGATGYQWRKDGVSIAGATATAYTINPVSTGGVANYTVIVSNACGTVTSNSAALTVAGAPPPPPPPAPTITVQPQSQSACPGTSVTFSVTAIDATAYQWRKNGSAIGGATLASFTIASADSTDDGSYDMVVGNASGAVTSDAALLSVGLRRTITVQPADQQVDEGAAVTFSVTATNATEYQWRKDGVDVTGATAATYTLDAVTLSDAGAYDVRVGNACGSILSDAATLTVIPTPASMGCGGALCGAGVAPLMPLTLVGIAWLKTPRGRRALAARGRIR
jgi:hypothetical protein